MKCHMLITWILKHTQKLGVILGGKLIIHLLYVLCLNRQKKHQILQEMFQSCLEEEIDVLEEV